MQQEFSALKSTPNCSLKQIKKYDQKRNFDKFISGEQNPKTGKFYGNVIVTSKVDYKIVQINSTVCVRKFKDDLVREEQIEKVRIEERRHRVTYSLAL